MYKIDFDDVKSEFAELFYSITKIMEEAELDLEDLKKFLNFYEELRIPLQQADTIAKIMQVIQQNSSFINCGYLKYVAKHFKLPAAAEKIDAYCKFVEKFCEEKLTQHSYVTSFLADPSTCLLSSETITFKLEWKPNKKTLTDIQSLLRKTFKRHASHIHIVVVGGGSVTAICYAPQYLMGVLVKLAQENMEVLVENSVTYLSVGYTVVLDKCAQEKVNCD